jgi:predicted TIM-barrel fold metal-dependent hydrolase
MIIDCHTHINNYHREDVESLQGCLDELQRQMRRNRINMALVLTSYKVTAGRPSTKSVVEVTRNVDRVFVVAGISYTGFTMQDLTELEPLVEEGSVKGLKLYPGYEPFYPHDPKIEPVYAFAERYKIPVMIHSGDTYSPTGKVKYAHPLQIDEVAVDHPNVNFVICHIGNPWIRDCMEVVYKNKNVYTDISGLVLGNFSDRFEEYMRKQLQEMILFGVEADNVLFGTDWPISSMESYIEFMDELKIPPRDKKKIFSENTMKIFRLEDDVAKLPKTGLKNLLT